MVGTIRYYYRLLKEVWKASNKFRQDGIIKGHFFQIKIFVDMILSYIKYGADAGDYIFFNFLELDSTERNKLLTSKRNGRIWPLLTAKEDFCLFLNKKNFNQLYSEYIHRKWLSTEDNSLKEAIELLKQKRNLILKPLTDYGGHGITFIEDNDSGSKALQNIFGKGRHFIIEEVIENCDSVKRLNPRSLNTLRIVTLLRKDGNVEILNVVQRFGVGNSKVDNATSGGLACRVDISTGKMVAPAYNLNNEEFFRHPESGLEFDGYQLPHITQCLMLVKKLAKERPTARYIGWDFVALDDGVELLEANIPPGHHLTQLGLEQSLWPTLTKNV